MKVSAVVQLEQPMGSEILRINAVEDAHVPWSSEILATKVVCVFDTFRVVLWVYIDPFIEE